jgi:cobalt-zinc-cadmium resistance protein CzcA
MLSDISVPSDVYDALSRNNQNTGGSYIEKVNRAYYIRSEGMITDLKDIEQIVVTNRGGIPVHVSDIAKVRYGAPKRFGAMTKDGEGECVGGIAMMLKGANANVVTQELEKRVAKVQKMLPEGVSVEPYLNRSELVNRNISTVIRNLVEGAIIVFLVLIYSLIRSVSATFLNVKIPFRSIPGRGGRTGEAPVEISSLS